MGTAKALLPFGEESLLQRVVRLIGPVAGELVVVAAAGQPLPALPGMVRVVTDQSPGRGPLEGVLAGLSALGADSGAAYVTSCDVPFLAAAFVQKMADLAQGYDIAVPRVDGYHHPLAAVYGTSVVPHIEALLKEDRLRPYFLFERVKTREVGEAELRGVDPELASLINLNHPADYVAALARAGLPAEPAVVARLSSTHDRA
jgi:molybdopterin-guanine dinucleotide biosynthesis protein A